MTQPLYTVRQVAYVVRDMEKALKYWTEYLKVGPFFMLEHALLKTKNTGWRIKCGYFYRTG